MNNKPLWFSIAGLFFLTVVGLTAVYSAIPPQQLITTTITSSTTVTATTTANQAEIDALNSKVSQLSSRVSSFQTTLAQQSNEIDILQIPMVVRDHLGATDILASYLVTPVISYIKNRTGFDFAFASPTIKTIIGGKLTRPDVELVSASKIQGHLYNVVLRLIVPFRLGEIPVAATAVNVVGDFTFYPYATFSATVDVPSQTVTNINYEGQYGVE